MFFYSQLYFPRFFPTAFEKKIQAKLSDSTTLNWERTQYKALLDLKRHASRMISSLEQLKGVTGAQHIDSLCVLIEKALENAISAPFSGAGKEVNALHNKFLQLKDEVDEYKNLEKCFSGCNLLANSMLTSISALGVVLFGAAVATGPLGVALLGIGMTILSALMLTAAAYSVYVDVRFIGDKQLKEIEAGINFLSDYPNVGERLEENLNSSCCI